MHLGETLYTVQKCIREALNKKNSKQSDIYQKGGVGSEFHENKFFFAIVTLGGVELCMTQFPSLNFSIFNLFLAHLHGNFQYFPYFWPN